MKCAIFFYCAAAGALLSSCGPSSDPDDVAGADDMTAPTAERTDVPGVAPDDGTRGDTLDPPVLTPEAEKGETGARNILVSFARQIELGRFDSAWSLLSEEDQKKWPKADFAALFDDLQGVTVAVPTGRLEGAAGSLYYTAPLTIIGKDPDGRSVAYEGQAVLRRVNDVDGATAEQLKWHFQSLQLDWTH